MTGAEGAARTQTHINPRRAFFATERTEQHDYESDLASLCVGAQSQSRYAEQQKAELARRVMCSSGMRVILVMSMACVSCFYDTQDITLLKGNDEPRCADDKTILPIYGYECTHPHKALADRKIT